MSTPKTNSEIKWKMIFDKIRKPIAPPGKIAKTSKRDKENKKKHKGNQFDEEFSSYK